MPTARRSRSTPGSALPTARTCRGPIPSPMIARELSEFFAGFAPEGEAVVQRRGRPHVPLERQRLLRARLLGGDPLPRCALLRGPGVRRGHARGRLAQGLCTLTQRCCTRTTTGRWSSCAATSTSTAACARAPGTSSPSGCGATARQVRNAGGGRPPLDVLSRGCLRARARGGRRARRSTTAGRRVFSALGSRAEQVPRPAA